jgi:molybdate transport system ATP-binding protein
MLRASLASRRGGFALETSLEVESSATLVLVGGSGAGKTSVLRLLAGLDRPERGQIMVDEATWFDGERDFCLPAHQRRVGYVAQDYALFPHLSVAENVAFGLRAQGTAARAISSRTHAALERLTITELARRRPGELSGGQQQRVALARALVLEPRLLLLDEPLAALDLQTRRAVRVELSRILAQLPCVTVYVTHSPLEAMVFGDRIAVIENGRVSQQGFRDDLLRRPRSAYVAEFMGLNLFQGRIVNRATGGLAALQTGDGVLQIADPGGDEDDVFVAVDPRDITLSLEAPSGSAQNVFRGPVVEIVPEPPFGERQRVALATAPRLVAEVTRSSVERLDLRPGAQIYATFKATGVTAYR